MNDCSVKLGLVGWAAISLVLVCMILLSWVFVSAEEYRGYQDYRIPNSQVEWGRQDMTGGWNYRYRMEQSWDGSRENRGYWEYKRPESTEGWRRGSEWYKGR